MEKITLKNGKIVKISKTKKAFEEAGYSDFKAGDTVLDIDHNVTTLLGIGYGLDQYASKKVLWCRSERGNISFYYYNVADFLQKVPKGYKF